MSNARWIAGALLLVPSFLLAQGAQGRVKGAITDAKSKQPIKGAKITVTCPEIPKLHREVTSDDKGIWAVAVVDATKQYTFHVSAVGYQEAEQIAKPIIGQTLELDFPLNNIADLQAAEQQRQYEAPGLKQLREGQELADAGKTTEARAKYAEAVAAKPDLYAAWQGMGDVDQKAGRNDDALAEVEKCLAVKPDFAPCLAVGMNAAQAKKDTSLYQKYATEYKNANPADPVVYYNEAVPLLNKGDDAKARPLLEKALEADPKYADAMFQLGMVLFRSGETAKAKELLQKFIAAAPNHKEVSTAKEMLKYM